MTKFRIYHSDENSGCIIIIGDGNFRVLFSKMRMKMDKKHVWRKNQIAALFFYNKVPKINTDSLSRQYIKGHFKQYCKNKVEIIYFFN